MTGTPLENRAEEFVNLIRFCDAKLASSLTTADTRLSSVASRQFERRVAPVYLRRNQEDVLHELPECLEKEEWVSLADEDERGYLRLLQSINPNLMTLRQATLGTAASSDGKLKRLREIIEDYRESGQKVVIFSFFLNTLKAVGDLVGKHHRIDGSVSASQRMSIIDQFQKQPGFGVLLAQIIAGGVGINLQAASSVVLVEPQFKPTTEWQAIKRVHRMGQTRRVVVHRLLARNTVDERLWKILHRKTETFDQYAKESAVKRASPAAIETTTAEVERKLISAVLAHAGSA